VGRHGDHRARRYVQEALRVAPQQHPGNSTVATRPDNDQIGACIFRSLCDEVGGIAVRPANDVEARVDARLNKVVHLRAEHDLKLVLVGEHRNTTGAAAQSLIRMDDKQLSTAATYEFQRRWQHARRLRIRPCPR
jgi:hypothetical protein